MSAGGWTDLVLAALVAAAAVAGGRRGGLRLAGAVLGLGTGLALGRALVPGLLQAAAPSLTGAAGRTALVGGVVVSGLLGAGVGGWVGSLPARLLARLHLGVLDRAAGAVGGAVVGLAVVGAALAWAGTTHLPSPAAGWSAAARGTALGQVATPTADRAAQLVAGPPSPA